MSDLIFLEDGGIDVPSEWYTNCTTCTVPSILSHIHGKKLLFGVYKKDGGERILVVNIKSKVKNMAYNLKVMKFQLGEKEKL